MKNGKKVLAFFMLSVILVVLFAMPVFAAENAIASVNVRVNLRNDGSAAITEVWDVRGVSGGTEYL